jgi:PAS domain S-box-containing protein
MVKEKPEDKTGGFYKDLLSICPEGIAVSDMNGVMIHISKKIYDIFDVPSGMEMIGKSIFEFVSQDNRQSAVEMIKTMFGKQETCSQKYVFLKFDRTPFPAEIIATPYFEKNGETAGFFSVIRHVTENTVTNEMLVIKEKMLNNATNGMAITKLDGLISFANHSAIRMWGYEDEKEIIGRPITDFWTENDDIDEVRSDLLIKKNVITEVRARKKDGSLFDVLMDITLISDEEEKPLYIMGSFTDITEKKKTEEKIFSSLREKEILFKEIHHRVKNNLQIVSSLLNLQMQNVTDPATNDILMDCQNRILSMAKLHESLYQSENLLYINFPDYINNIVMHLLISYDVVNKIKISMDIDDINLNMDTAIPCGLIINEILSNSIKHGFSSVENKDKLIDISMKYDKVDSILLKISDNGQGIPKDSISKTRSLGMKLIFALIEQLKGNVDINTEKGTSFVIEFDGKEPQ